VIKGINIMNSSFQEKSLWLEFSATVIIFSYYLNQLLGFDNKQLADGSLIIGVLFEVVMYTVVLMIISSVILAIINHKDADKPLDEREQLIELKGSYYSNWVLKVGIVIAIGQYALESNEWAIGLHQNIPFLPLHILVVSFLLSELVSFFVQIWLSHKGV